MLTIILLGGVILGFSAGRECEVVRGKPRGLERAKRRFQEDWPVVRDIIEELRSTPYIMRGWLVEDPR
jgi:hypothetical protein